MLIRFPLFRKRHVKLHYTLWLFVGNVISYFVIDSWDVDPYSWNEVWHSSELDYKRSSYNKIRLTGS